MLLKSPQNWIDINHFIIMIMAVTWLRARQGFVMPQDYAEHGWVIGLILVDRSKPPLRTEISQVANELTCWNERTLLRYLAPSSRIVMLVCRKP